MGLFFELIAELFDAIILEGALSASQAKKMPRSFFYILFIIFFSLSLFFFYLAYSMREDLTTSLIFSIFGFIFSFFLYKIFRGFQKMNRDKN